MSSIPREAWLAAVAILCIAGGAATVARLLRARRHGLSIRLQVFLAMASTITVLNAAFAAIVIDRFEARTTLFARKAAEDEAHVVAALAESFPRGSPELRRALFGIARAGTGTRVQLFDAQGTPLFDSGEADQTPSAVGLAPLASGGQARVELPTLGMVQVVADVAPKVALLAVLLAGAAAFAAVLIGRAVGRPIERLTHTAERVAKGERQAALPQPQGREVRALTEALDSMRRELEQRHALEAFVTDLSHELKNPIASILAAAEVLEEAIASEPAAAQRFARHIQDSAGKLSSLVADLLSLARLEAHGLSRRVDPIDLMQLVRSAADALSTQAAARGVRVELLGPDHAPARGDSTWLRRAVENLLANALAFAPPGSAVTIALGQAGRGWELLVTDRGPGIADAMRPRLFQRFATTRGEQGGTGLGLAIVRAVAEAHGGSANLRATSGSGTSFALVVPRSA